MNEASLSIVDSSAELARTLVEFYVENDLKRWKYEINRGLAKIKLRYFENCGNVIENLEFNIGW